jgi:CheY-like chemotaxis protein
MELDGTKYYLKAMNCPHHHKIFDAEPKSYKDMPLRLAEYGTCYRYEQSGELFGLMRVRCLHMNDAHIYCTKEQFAAEFRAVNDMYLKYFKIFGIDKYVMRLSLHDPAKLGQKYINEPELWLETEAMVRSVLIETGTPFVEVQDEGAGMEPDLISRIFEPFYTTKRDGGGTGLGLSTVLGILRQSGGHVSVRSRPGEDSRFRLWFPRVAAEPDNAVVHKPGVHAIGAGRRLLLVEDEAPLHRLLTRALTTAGYEVTAVEDGEAALGAIAAGLKPDLVISDVAMPGSIDGLTLARRLRETKPDLPIVLMSGYAEGTLSGEVVTENFYFLQKPFRISEMLSQIAGALTRH